MAEERLCHRLSGKGMAAPVEMGAVGFCLGALFDAIRETLQLNRVPSDEKGPWLFMHGGRCPCGGRPQLADRVLLQPLSSI